MDGLNQNASSLIRRLYDFVYAERDANQAQLFDIWARPVTGKLAKGWSQGFTHLERGPSPQEIWAYTDESESRFRINDLLLLHTGHADRERICGQLKFIAEEEGRWLLKGNLATTVWDHYQSGHCYADPDGMDLTPYYERALEEIASSARGRECLLPLLDSSPVITFIEQDVIDGEHFARKQGCNLRQSQAVGMALGAEQIACIQGPPGTGKTRALSLIAEQLVARGERVFMTSHTHMAINNALNKIASLGVPTVKVAGSREGLDAWVSYVDDLANWDNLPADGGYVVGATPFATCNRLDAYTFDTVIFDEASQITLPLALMAMRKGSRYIFIGDQKQLPPVMLSKSILSDDSMSIFSLLTTQNADHTVMLDQTYRMNQWLTEWPSQSYYKGRLKPAGNNEQRRFALDRTPSRLKEVFDPQFSMIFIPTGDRSARTRNLTDARWVAEICHEAHSCGLPLSQIGIVTPFRAQGRLIRKLLTEKFGRNEAKEVIADTVERMQGQERELIILSLASGDEVFIRAITEFFFQPERLNVSITRAMTKLVIIGPEVNEVPLSTNEKTQEWIAQYMSLISRCKHARFE